MKRTLVVLIPTSLGLLFLGSSVCGGYPEPTPTPWAPTTYPHNIPRWTPDNTRIVFERDASIYVVDVDGTQAEPVLQGSPGADYYFSPSVSPDGSRIAYVAAASEGYDKALYTLATARIDGSDKLGLVSARETLTHPVWSPDGKSIAYLLGLSTLATVDADASDSRVLVDETPEGTLSTRVRAPVGPPAWSPDGRYIAFVATEQSQSEVQGGETVYRDILYSVRVDGSELYRVADAQRRSAYYYEAAIGAPDWSPDGELTFGRSGREPIGDTSMSSLEAGVYVSNPDGNGERQLVAGLETYSAEWSPNGTELLLRTRDIFLGNVYCAYAVNADGSALRFLAHYSSGAWAPDGSGVALRGIGGLISTTSRDGTATSILSQGTKPTPTPGAAPVCPSDIEDARAYYRRYYE